MTDSACRVTILQSPGLANPRTYLASYDHRCTPPTDPGILAQLAATKTDAPQHGNQLLAKAVWCLETIAQIQDHYLQAFVHLKQTEYYKGWCQLERSEINLGFLDRHYSDSHNRFGLRFIRAHVTRFQRLFPYRWFASPEILKTDMRCTICGALVTPRTPCGHRPGDIYDGQMCAREIRGLRFLGLSLVDNPVQKYSVFFLQGGDRYDYTPVKFVADRLRSPWHAWSCRRTTALHPHDRYRDIPPNAPCPCESGLVYQQCCLKRPGVRRPHCQITFSVPFDSNLPAIALTD